jgi:hypothetical protein
LEETVEEEKGVEDRVFGARHGVVQNGIRRVCEMKEGGTYEESQF